jgi:hypothetical protein
MPTTQQADGEIHEDQLLNFLIKTLTGAFSLGASNRRSTMFRYRPCVEGNNKCGHYLSEIVLISHEMIDPPVFESVQWGEHSQLHDTRQPTDFDAASERTSSSDFPFGHIE